jgi:hypothetical protein
MSASTADRGLSLIELDLDLGGEIILQPKGEGKGGLRDYYSIYALNVRCWRSPSDPI